MFGCCIAGRLLQTNLQQIDETHAAFELPAAGSINHVCVFLLGTGEFCNCIWQSLADDSDLRLSVPFPEGYGATVHLFWPGKGFQLLGMSVSRQSPIFHHLVTSLQPDSCLRCNRLSNEKPSAIFRLRGNFTSQYTAAQAAFSNSSSQVPGADVTAVLGIAIEPLSQIMTQVGSLPSALTPQPSDPAVLAEKIVKHMFNYISGFVSGSSAAGSALTPDSTVPMSLIARWYESFLSKVRGSGIGFLDRQD